MTVSGNNRIRGSSTRNPPPLMQDADRGGSYSSFLKIGLAAVLALLLVSCVFAGAAAAAPQVDGGITWDISGDTLTISAATTPETGFASGQMKDCTDGYLAPWMESADSLAKLVIEDGVTTIGDCAFAGCSGFTGSLIIPASVTTIGDCAFAGCSGFTGSLTIPNSVTTIGDYTFDSCSGFTGSLTIGNSVMTIGERVFYKCSGFTGDLVIPDSVTTIGKDAFCDCSGFTGSLTIGKNVTTIGDYAFYGCSGFTGDLSIPNSVTTIDDWAFGDCSGFTGSLTIGNSVTMIGYFAFSGCGFTGDLSIPNSVTTIGNGAFCGCSGFTGSLTLGNSVTTIGDSAFDGYCGFTGDLVIPDSVTTIGKSAFVGCSGFTGSLTLGNSVTTIGESAFHWCSGFTGDLVIPASVTTIGDQAFRDCSGFTGSLTLGNSVTTIGDIAFSGCGFTGDLVIPASVTTIGDWAFYSCSGFTGSLTLGNSVTTIGDIAFSECGFTGDLVIPASVTTIGESAFHWCSGFTGDLVIPASVTTIGDYAFNECSGIRSLTIGSGVKTIGDYAFSECGLTSDVVIPSGVTSIGQYILDDQKRDGYTFGGWYRDIGLTDGPVTSYVAGKTYYPKWSGPVGTVDGGIVWSISDDGTLTISPADTPETGYAKGQMKDYTYDHLSPWWSYKDSLTKLVIEDGVTTIGDFTFSQCSGITGSLIIPTSVTTIGQYAFFDCSSFTGSLTIGENVTTIGDYAFYYCSGFTSPLTIPASVTTIGYGAFYGCSGFTGDLVIPDSVTTIDDYAFNDCSSINDVFIPVTVTTIGEGAFKDCSSLSIIYTAGDPALLVGKYPSEVPLAATNGGKITEFPAAPLLPSASQMVKEGSTFLGWKDSAGASVTEYVPKQTGVEGGKYFAQWSDTPAQKYTVTFDSNGGSAVPPAEVASGSTVAKPAAPVKAGYDFNGWYTDTGCTIDYDFSTPVTSSFTLYAKWTGSGPAGNVDGGIVWSISDGTLTISPAAEPEAGFAKGQMKDYTIENPAPWMPSKDNLTKLIIEDGVTTIGDYAFWDCSGFTGSLTIPDSVTTIGYCGFAYCIGFTDSLTIGENVTMIGGRAFDSCFGFTGSLTIPDSVTTIGSQAFAYCRGFTDSLIIPSSVTTIDNYAFGYCSGITNIFVGSENNNFTSINGVLYDKEKTKLICCPAGKPGTFDALQIPISVTTIGGGAFLGCSGFTGSLVIPATVTTIDEWAFRECSGFTDVFIPSSVGTIGYMAFSGSTSLSIIYTAGDPALLDGKYPSEVPLAATNGGKITEFPAAPLLPSASQMVKEGSTFLGWKDSTGASVTEYVPKQTGVEGGKYFAQWSDTPAQKYTVTFDSNGGSAVPPAEVASGSTVAKPAAPVKDGYDFNGWHTDTGCTIGYDFSTPVTSSFTLYAKWSDTPVPVGTVDGGIMWSISDDGTLTISKADTPEAGYAKGEMKNYTYDRTYGSTSPWMPSKSDLKTLVINDGVTKISPFAFYDCSGFTGDLVIPTSVTTIGERAFQGCSGFTGSLVIPSSITTIGYSTFYGCRGFTGSLIIPASVTTISDSAFSSCSKITGILVSDENLYFTSDNGVLYSKNKTKLICCPAGKTGTFNALNIPSSVTTIGDSAFSECSFTDSLTIPSSVTTIGSLAFCGCSGFTGSLVIPSSVTTIGSGAFQNCSGFTGSPVISSSVTTIGNDAFYGCSGFTGDLVIPSSVMEIGNYAFRNCSGLTGAFIPASVISIGDWAFYGCTSLSVIYTAGNPALLDGKYPFIVPLAATNGGIITEFPTAPLLPSTSQMVKEGSTFLGWKDSAGASVTEYVPKQTGVEGGKYFAQWSDTPAQKYTVTFDSNGGSAVPPAEVASGSTVAKPAAPVKDGYDFNGWHTDTGCTIGYDFSTPVTSSFTLYAKWRAVPAGNVDGGIVWSISDGTLTISPAGDLTQEGYTSGQMKDYDSSIENQAPWYPSSSSLTKLVINDGVTTIGKCAFYCCSGLTSPLTIPDSVTTIGERAFKSCTGFTGTLVIPNKVSEIGDGAFQASGFTGDLVIPDSVITIDSWAFIDCSGITSLTIGNGVKTIGESAFARCGLTGNLVIPGTVMTIGDNVFDGCTSLSIIYTAGDPGLLAGKYPSGVSLAATNGGKITEFPVAPTLAIPVKAEYIFDGWYKNENFSGEKVTTYEAGWKYYAKWVKVDGGIVWSINDGTLTISPAGDQTEKGYTSGQMKDYDVAGNQAPWYPSRSSLTKLVIEDGVTTIGSYAFYGCSGLTSPLTIPDSVTTIGLAAFKGCTGFTSTLVIPDKVTTIGDGAFKGCTGFTDSLIIPDSVTAIGAEAFIDCSGITSLTIGSGVKTIGESAFARCSLKSSVTIPAGVTSIGAGILDNQKRDGYTFGGWYRDSGLTDGPVTSYVAGKTYYPKWSGPVGTVDGGIVWSISDGTLTISPAGAQTQEGYTSGQMKDYDSYIENQAPWYPSSSSLTKLVINDGVTTIGKCAFYCCSGLTSPLTIPDSVTTIGERAFKGCTGFTGTLVIPNKVTTIGLSAFRDCSGFTGSLIIPDSVTTIGDYAFDGCSGITSLTIGSGVVTIGESAFTRCGLKSSVTIPAGVTSIGAGILDNQKRDGYTFGGWYRDTGLTDGPVTSYVAGKTYYPKWNGVVPGAITITDIDTPVYHGDKLNIEGTTTFDGELTVFMWGENFAFTDVKDALSNIPSGAEWSTQIDTSKLRMDGDNYTIYVAKLAPGVTSDEIQSASYLDDTTLCTGYAFVHALIKPSFINITSIPEVTVKGGNFVVKGQATGSPDEVMWYIFGTEFFKTGFASVTDGTFELNLQDDNMGPGSYFLVIQHPMYDKVFNVGPVVNPGGGYDIMKNIHGSYNGQGAAYRYTINDSGDAYSLAKALCEELNDENHDDVHVKALFYIESPMSVIYSIPTKISKGEIFTISGTTVGHAGDTVTVQFAPEDSAKVIPPYETTVKNDGSWMIVCDTSVLDYGDYNITVTVGSLPPSESHTFTIVEGSAKKGYELTAPTSESGGPLKIIESEIICKTSEENTAAEQTGSTSSTGSSTDDTEYKPGDHVTVTMKIGVPQNTLNEKDTVTLRSGLASPSWTVNISPYSWELATSARHLVIHPQLSEFDLVYTDWSEDTILDITLNGYIPAGDFNPLSIMNISTNVTGGDGFKSYSVLMKSDYPVPPTTTPTTGPSETVAPPSIAPNGGTFAELPEITLTADNKDAVIYYRVDSGSAIQYTVPFTLTDSAKVTAWAELNGKKSLEVSASFVKYNPDKTYQITIESAAGGSIATSVTEAKAGDLVTITPTPDDGYIFGGWTIFGKDTETSADKSAKVLEFAMWSEDVTITPKFVDDPTPKPSSVKITHVPQSLYESDTGTFNAETYDQFGKIYSENKVRWSSSARGVIEIDSVTGAYTAKSAGSSIIRAVSTEDSTVYAETIIPVYLPPSPYISSANVPASAEYGVMSGYFTITSENTDYLNWDWGDGGKDRQATSNSTSSIDKAAHIFIPDRTGTLTVSLTPSNAYKYAEGSDVKKFSVNVHYAAPKNVKITDGPSSVVAGDSAWYTAFATGADTYVWRLNGTEISGATGPAAAITFPEDAPTVSKVSVTAVKVGGGETTAEKEVRVAQPYGELGAFGSFSTNPENPGVNEAVILKTDPVDNAVGYRWNIGGVVKETTAPSVSYSTPQNAGNVNVTVTAVNAAGSTASHDYSFYVGSKPEFTVDKKGGEGIPDTYTYTATVISGSVTSWSWFIDDKLQTGETGSSFTKTWTIDDYGPHIITVTAVNDYGKTTKNFGFKVIPKKGETPVIKKIAGPDVVNGNGKATYTAVISCNDEYTIAWYLDGAKQTSTDHNIKLENLSAGNHKLLVEVTTEYEASASYEKIITVSETVKSTEKDKAKGDAENPQNLRVDDGDSQAFGLQAFGSLAVGSEDIEDGANEVSVKIESTKTDNLVGFTEEMGSKENVLLSLDITPTGLKNEKDLTSYAELTFRLLKEDVANPGEIEFFRLDTGNAVQKWVKLNKAGWKEDGEFYVFTVKSAGFSTFVGTAVSAGDTPSPAPTQKPSSSGTGSGSVWATSAPTLTATPTPTPTPGNIPSVKPIDNPEQTGKSPMPFLGILAGLGAAAVLFGLRRK